jgi:cellulose synthase/poly-beta-1,6-N-acetylglucosamine synthase-like glycosyltransferase
VRALVVIPTYNEAESVVTVLDRVLAADPRVDVLVVDDGAPTARPSWSWTGPTTSPAST